ncbi:esterase [Paenibacillus sp. J31TS4]|uniref:PaaI family thioesterase n=1 Tax=Paenibacillus sp. J31TS4 TaxID=2807195 RepID=UPI001B0B3711|nr:PaaI family thioesterase [Paenibacillus sp. J31TS4]GIP38859.1 esterase [Paenibacillus sp. J31TS4]
MEPDNRQEALRRMEEQARPTFWGYLGCELVSLDEHRAVVALDIQEHHLNLIGILHGGVHTSLLDSAMGLLAMEARPDADVVTSNLNMHFTAPVGKGKVLATAELLHRSGKMITAQGRLTDERSTLLSLATASFRVIDRKRS